MLHSVNQLDLQISDMTARRHLHETNVHFYHVARKIVLKHPDNCVGFALHQINTAPEDCDRTFWTDEKVFCSSYDRRLRIWRPKNHRFDPKYVVLHKRSECNTCAMWVCISAHCPGELIEV